VALPGFGQFMITRFSPLCWALPATPTFNSKDAYAKQVLAEAGGLQRIIYGKMGMEYIEYLRDRELPGMGMGGDLVEEYVGTLSRLDLRGFRQFFPVCPIFFIGHQYLANSLIVIYPTIERMNFLAFYT
jgi:exportin-T